MKYLSARHQRLMRESEVALESALGSESPDTSRLATQVLGDAKIHSLWESHHAQLLVPVAEHGKRQPQILELRKLETKQLHRSSLITFIRKHQITGPTRDRLFAVFYGPKDPVDAILTEHRNYLLSESSRMCADHLIDVMHDSTSQDLLRLYASAYETYFSLYCYVACSRDTALAEAITTSMIDARQRVNRLRKEVMTAKPAGGFANFDRAAMLAETGRHRAVNYLNR